MLIKTIRGQARENYEKAENLESKNEELVRLYQEKEKAEEKYRLLVDTAADAIFIAQDRRMKFPNPRTYEMLGYSQEELLQIRIGDVIHPDDRDMVEDRHRKRISGDAVVSHYAFRVIDKNGKILWVELNSAFILWENRPATLNLMRDITRQKKLEDKYQKSQKIQAIGTLAGGIAHDFNNILTGIFAFAHLARKNCNDPEKVKKNIDEVVEGSKKAADLIQQILTVSRQSENEKSVINPLPIIKEALKLLQASLPSSISISTDMYSNQTILADPTKIHQIVMNLCINASHAMADAGGVLAVTLRDVDVSDRGSIPELDIPQGSYVKLEVSDTGCGMDTETIQKIFDPYFTTRETGEGSGLGLAIISGIVEEHHGHIKVYSELGQGSSFHVFLPASDIQSDDSQSSRKAVSSVSGSETLMIVDDDPQILVSFREALTEQGYTVLSFTNGVRALASYEQSPERFDLIITDMTMPEMTGLALSKQVLALNPSQKIFICTGFSETLNREKAFELGVSGYLEKPLMVDTLLTEIRNVMDDEDNER